MYTIRRLSSAQEGILWVWLPAVLVPEPSGEHTSGFRVAPGWGPVGPGGCVVPCPPRRTCDIGHPQGFLVLGRLGAVLAALLAARGAGTAEVDLSGLEEGHHEGLLVLGPVPPDQARQLGVDALP